MAPTQNDDLVDFGLANGEKSSVAKAAKAATSGDRKAIEETEVELRVVLGTATLRVRDILKLGRGAVVELDRSVRSTADVYVAGFFVGRGDVAMLEERMGVTITELFKSERAKR
ncbi:MAG TPA: FliM/FliN family flagellar motor switch protein [Azospirillaceae bacterium]|nr:FliM/FliN family flagellar motor switch protein [Azospirillaceae bacterium]